MSFSLLFKFFYRQLIHDPPKPTASFKGKTVIVTGGNTGLGLEASRWIVRLGASQVILACRNTSKGEAAAKDIQQTTSCSPDTIRVWPLDMSSYSSVCAFADRAKTELPRLDALIANAGVANDQYNLAEGIEETIVINLISTTLLAFLLHPKLQETAQQYKTKTHFTAVGSAMYSMAKFKERDAPAGELFEAFNVKDNYNTEERYSTSKLLLHFALREMAALSPVESSGVVIDWVDPGLCHSGLGRGHGGTPMRIFKKLFARPTEVGSRTLVDGASAAPEMHGHYLEDYEVAKLTPPAIGKTGQELQARVWDELRFKLEGIRKGVTVL